MIVNKRLGFRPVGQRVLVKKPEVKQEEEVTKSGIVLTNPLESKESLQTIAEVLAVGDEVQGVKVGDIVKFEYPHPLKLKDEDYYLVNEKNILLILDEPLT